MNLIKITAWGHRAWLLLIVLISLSQFSLYAQEKDFATWANVGFKYKVKPAFAISGGLEWRTKENLGMTDRLGMKLGGAYKALPFLELGAGYELHYRNRGTDGWKFRQRYYVDGTLSTRVQRWKLSLREHFQHTFDNNSDEFRLRSRMKLAYVIPKCILEPYASVEMYNGLNRGENFAVKRMRYRGGVALPLSTRWTTDVFYCRQWEQNKRINIVGVECSYNF